MIVLIRNDLFLRQQLEALERDPWLKIACAVIQLQMFYWISKFPVNGGELQTALPLVNVTLQIGRLFWGLNFLKDRLTKDPDQITSQKITGAVIGFILTQGLCAAFGLNETVRNFAIKTSLLSFAYCCYKKCQRNEIERQLQFIRAREGML